MSSASPDKPFEGVMQPARVGGDIRGVCLPSVWRQEPGAPRRRAARLPRRRVPFQVHRRLQRGLVLALAPMIAVQASCGFPP